MRNFGRFFNDTLGPLGFDVVGRYNAFSGPYNPDSGWPLSLPDVEFGPKTLVVLHFQDFVTMVNGRCLELDRVEQHYGANSHRVLVTYWTSDLDQWYSGPVNLIKFSNHNYDIAREFAENWQQWKYITQQPRTRAWQCLNGRLCLHRRRVVDILQHWPNGWLSYGTEIALPQHDYSHLFNCENYPNFLGLDYVYSSAAVNIVTETQYDPPIGIVTEKTLMAIAAQQIPIVIGHQGIVQHCRELGFDMFDDLVNTSYDDLPNRTRAEQAILLNRKLICGEIDLTGYQARLEHNRRYLLEQFPVWMETQFQQAAEQLAYRLSVREPA